MQSVFLSNLIIAPVLTEVTYNKVGALSARKRTAILDKNLQLQIATRNFEYV